MFKNALYSLNASDFERFVLYREPGQDKFFLLFLDSASPETRNDYFAVRGFNAENELRYPILKEFSFDQSDWISESKNQKTFHFGELDKHGVAGQQQFVEMVNNAINQIESGLLEKVVLARCFFEDTQVIDLFRLFENLCANHEVYAYVFHDQNDSTWAGASPELLIKREGNKVSSMALAGTRVGSSNHEWAEKEVKEQRIVSDYIYETFVDHKLREVQQPDTFTLSTGKLQHICSKVTGLIDSSTNILKLIKALHPTPALGGFPKQDALQFIRNNEPFERAWYGGYLGRVNQNKMALFVNIRCVQIGNNGVKYFAGAGINQGSNAEREWVETENKLSVMRSLIESLKIDAQS